MKPGELVRVRMAFGVLGAVPVFLAGWLGWLQVAQAGTLRRPSGRPFALVAEAADRQGWRRETVPAPRGTIVDRSGRELARDCANYEVRANITVPLKCRRELSYFRPWVQRLVDGFALALVADPQIPDRSKVHKRHRERLAKVFAKAWRVDRLPRRGPWPKEHSHRIDVLIGRGIDRLLVVDALREWHLSDDYPTISIALLHSYRRVYPERELTYGIVGHCESRRVDQPGEEWAAKTFGLSGLESFAALEPGAGGSRRFLADGRHRPYFVAPVTGAQECAVLHATLDLDLQRIAVRELREQCEKGVLGDPKKTAKWGALVLLELATGDVLAAASWHKGDAHPQATSFTPLQSKFEPGSIVKPLVLSYAHEVGALDWGAQFDCHPRGEMYRERIRPLGRRKAVKDDHTCNKLTAHGILVNSSNIGAALVGLQLTREQWQDYMRAYGFGQRTGLNLPGEVRGGNHPQSFNPKTPLRSFRANSAISFSFGYELETSAMQVARAYLRMFRGLGAELRLVRGLEFGGEWHAVPPKRDVGPSYRPAVVDAVRRAMVDVVSNDTHATGRFVHQRVLKETGIDLHGLIGGKTGTAASSVRTFEGKKISARNASFVGFVPADQPRWLAVCVLQKDDSASFYGGSYAAPPAVKLLLQCHEMAERGQLCQEQRNGSGGQTRDTSMGVPRAGSPSGVSIRSPGSSGWNVSVGAGASRDTR